MNLIKKNEIEKEMEIYTNFANNIVGVLLLTLSLGSLGTNNPQATAIVLLPIACWIFYFMGKNYPPSIKILEELLNNNSSKEEKDEIRIIIKRFRSENFNYKKIFTLNLMYLFNTLFYWSIIIFPNFGIAIKQGQWLNELTSYIVNALH